MTEEQARNHPGVLAGTRRAQRNQSELGGWRTVSIVATHISARRYNQSEKGRLNHILHAIHYQNKLADARDAADLVKLLKD